MEIKQHTTKQPIGQRRNQNRNQKKIPRKMKWKYNIPQLTSYNKSSSEGSS